MLGDKGERRHMLGDKERCDHTFGVPSETPNLCFGLYSSFLIGSGLCRTRRRQKAFVPGLLWAPD